MNRRKSITKTYATQRVIDENTPGHESFSGTINFLINNAAKSNRSIAYQEIAMKLAISDDQFNTFYTTDIAPPEIFTLLKSQYKEFLPDNIEFIAYKFEIEIDAPPDPMGDDDTPSEDSSNINN